MGLFEHLGFDSNVRPAIDWDLLPAETFSIFESWGGKIRLNSSTERFYYFFIDTWETPASLCLMERGVKHAKILARIHAPQQLIDKAVASQGKTMGMDKHYSIDNALKMWLKENIIDIDNFSMVTPIHTDIEKESMETGLPANTTSLTAQIKQVRLNNRAQTLQGKDVSSIIEKTNFFDSQRNPTGYFPNFLVDNKDGLTVSDKVTGLMWQRAGLDITSLRKMRGYVEAMNKSHFAGFNDWRLPTMEEALSLLEPQMNDKEIHLHKCFSKEQPFIFLADKRDPGGYWFCDFKQGTVFWASGTIPGAFGRLCRNLT